MLEFICTDPNAIWPGLAIAIYRQRRQQNALQHQNNKNVTTTFKFYDENVKAKYWLQLHICSRHSYTNQNNRSSVSHFFVVANQLSSTFSTIHTRLNAATANWPREEKKPYYYYEETKSTSDFKFHRPSLVFAVECHKW